MPRYDPVDDILSNRRNSEFWQGTLQQLAQIPQMLMQRRAQADAHRAQTEERQANTEIRRGQLQLQQRQLALSERAQEMEQGVQMLVSQAMEDAPDGTKRVNKSRLMQGFAQHQVPLEMQQKTLASITAVDELMSKHETNRRELAANVINAALDAGGTPEAVMLGIAYGKANGWLKDQEIAPIYELLASDQDPKPVLQQMRDSLTDKYRKDQKEKGPLIVPAGATALDPTTRQPIFTSPTKAAEAPNVGSFEDYVVRRFGANPTAAQIAQGRKDYQQADDRPLRTLAPIVIQGAGGPMLLDRGSQTAAPVKDAQGNVVGPAPTANERNEARSYAKAKPILSAISELSEKINTGRGAMAKISGAIERAKSQANLNDDVSEYEALISGFTPLIARALGHVGVLTEQDVQSVKAMFPRPGDSKSVRDRKVARIESLMGQIEGQSAPATKPPGAPPAVGAPSYQDYLNSRKKGG